MIHCRQCKIRLPNRGSQVHQVKAGEPLCRNCWEIRAWLRREDLAGAFRRAAKAIRSVGIALRGVEK